MSIISVTVLAGVASGLLLLGALYAVKLLRLMTSGKLRWEGALLAGLFFAGAGVACACSLMQVWWVQELRGRQAVMARISSTRVMVQNLLVDVSEYRRTHPSIDPVLQSLNLLTTNRVAAPAASSPGQPAAQRPSAK